MPGIWDRAYGAISGAKTAFGLQDVNLFPGDVSKQMTGVPAQEIYGVPTSTGRGYYPSGGPSLPYTQPQTLGQQQTYSQPQQAQPSGGGGGVPYPNPSNDWMNEQNRLFNEQNQQSSGPSEADIYNQQMRGEISSGYDAYFSDLDKMLNELPNQKTAQQGIVGSQFDQGVTDLEAEKAMGAGDLALQRQRTEKSQVKSLGDIGESIRNQFQSGQVKLGSMGAGDSSAVGQYSYALAKLGSKARGDVMSKTADIQSEIDNREFKLNTIFSTEKTRLGSARDQQLSGIEQWFSEATNRIRQMSAEGKLSKSQDLASITREALNMAMQQAQQVQQNFLNRQGMLEAWALNNSENITQVRQNMSQVGSFNPAQPQAQPIQGQMAFGTQQAPRYYGGGQAEEEKRPFYG